jgi:hypothetical protein
VDFPRLVFRSPGLNKCNGGTYGHVLVNDDAEYRAALAAGYHHTVPDALKHAGEKPKDAPSEKPVTPQVHTDVKPSKTPMQSGADSQAKIKQPKR